MTEHPLWHLTMTRIRLFFREPGAVFWAFGFPLLLTMTLGIAFRDRPPEAVDVAVQAGPGADAIAATLAASADFHVVRHDGVGATAAMRAGKVALIVIPGPPVVYTYDPNRPDSRLGHALVDAALQRAAGRTDPVITAERPQSEPGSRYIDFLLPGLLGMSVMSSSMWGIGYVIVETRTRKLLKRMVATPMSRWHYLLSFVLMRLVFLVIEVPTLLLFGVIAFDVAIRGSLVLVAAITLLGALAFGGIGLLVASRARNTQTVSGLMNLVMMPMYIGSGVFFSASHFPEVVQPLVKALPLTALNDALRAVINEGAGEGAILPEIALLAAVALVCFAVALRVFRWG